MDNKMLMKLMEKKKDDGSQLDPAYKDAKMGVLKDLHDHMGKMIGGDMMGMKKVTVASPDKEGLSEGLDKAHEMLGDQSDSEDESEMENEEDEMSPEELEMKIRELQDLLAKKKV